MIIYVDIDETICFNNSEEIIQRRFQLLKISEKLIHYMTKGIIYFIGPLEGAVLELITISLLKVSLEIGVLSIMDYLSWRKTCF